uniref:Peptidase A1 domain-containing protein n=1 Tax=Odontella aurita TaxID=265563 RepID=A0A7S4JP66_9STRA|mmetsp:Transcript_50712/g.152737  ORF Transcript_50712/g.152737 Transcript_50712/m.152737 type:complete len:450 (+) Transcript_50712:13-1362(+)|eukprot:CAMPEP_0113553528 /NCGR_PEP_ID=MMETSP0015_2-20120614/15661_1 /TAXON_ID=2838 /ORGANISM="Odontella" /LENGTH=449 /DNA_ID=CAMNT_0000454603 /DNA_START=13 /DNA_END=1362 /DNA_ORIENTATION=- /assembly_acc=CAM_ASM_000160
MSDEASTAKKRRLSASHAFRLFSLSACFVHVGSFSPLLNVIRSRKRERHSHSRTSEEFCLRGASTGAGDGDGDGHGVSLSRRSLFGAALTPLVIGIKPSRALEAGEGTSGALNVNVESPLVVPLRYVPSLSAYVVSYTVGGAPFGAIVDTGSPFLFVPSYCDDTKWGCYRPSSSQPTGLEATYEQFEGNEGLVEWRSAPFSFLAAGDDVESELDGRYKSLTASLFPSFMTFGVISESLMDGPGGIFLGLVRDTDSRIRPSFLGQSSVSAFSVDLRPDARPKNLALSRNNAGWIPGDAIPLVRDLNKRYGDPTIHYVAEALSLSVNGSPLASSSNDKKKKKNKTYVIFDTGCSGMVIDPDLFDERYAAARANREKSLWGKVDVSFATERGDTMVLSANKPITTPFGSDERDRFRPWQKRFDGHLIVLGLAFLDGKKTSVDIDGGRLWVDG